MDYYWIDCPRCGCQVAINLMRRSGRTFGSLRRWSADRTTNDGRLVEIDAGKRNVDGSFSVTCVCGQDLPLPAVPAAVGAEREA